MYTVFKSETKKEHSIIIIELLAVKWVPYILRHALVGNFKPNIKFNLWREIVSQETSEKIQWIQDQNIVTIVTTKMKATHPSIIFLLRNSD